MARSLLQVAQSASASQPCCWAGSRGAVCVHGCPAGWVSHRWCVCLTPGLGLHRFFGAHAFTNGDGSSGLHWATAHGRFAEAFPKGPCARAGTHGAGMPPLECGAPLRCEGLYRAGARPML